MKLAELLIMTCCSIIAIRSETAETEQEALLKRASEQLERLAPYRRLASRRESDLMDQLEVWRSPGDRNDLLDGATRNDAEEQSSPWEILEILPDETAKTEDETAKRIDGENDDEEKRITIGIIADPKYTAMMQERIKRGFNAGYASLLTGIAGGVVSGVASASSSSAAKASTSSGDSAYGKPAYSSSHPVYTLEEKTFGPWDFKNAIFSTLFQALKAIGGGVLALKGQLVKGSGYLLSAKSKVFSKTGDAITSFGKHLASSVVPETHPYPPDPYYDHHPPIQHIEHGPPPGLDDFSEVNDYSPHAAYSMPSEDSDQGGLLIVTPTRSDPDGHYSENVAQEKPNLTKLEESFGGPAKGSIITDLLNSVPKGSVPGGSTAEHQTAVGQSNGPNNNANYPYPLLQHPAPTYGAPDHYFANHDNPANQNYHAAQDDVYRQPETPSPPQAVTSSQHHLPDYPSLPNPPLPNPPLPNPPLPNPPLSHPPLLNHPPLPPPIPIGHPPIGPLLHAPVGPLGGPLAGPLLHTLGSKLPHAANNDDGLSVYASISVDTEPQLTPVKTPLLGYPGTVFDLPKLQPHADFHGRPYYGGLDGPLRIQLLNSSPFWQGQGSFAPAFALGTLGPFRKRNIAQQRRTSANRLARRSSSLHRP